jgi:hypothetical protein
MRAFDQWAIDQKSEYGNDMFDLTLLPLTTPSTVVEALFIRRASNVSEPASEN